MGAALRNLFGVMLLTLTGLTALLGGTTAAAEPVNTPPLISHISRKAVDEDGRRRALFTVADAETPARRLRVRARSSDQALLPDARLTVTGTGSLRRVLMEPAPDRFGTVRVTVTVSDGSLRAQESFRLEVRPVNDSPSFSCTPPAAGKVGIVYAFPIVASDADPGDTLALSAPAKPAWLELVPAAGGLAVLTGVPSLADAGEHPVELLVTDAQGATGTLAWTLAVPLPPPVAGPIFDPPGGNFDGPLPVTIASSTEGAIIRYTRDGTTPTGTNGTLYSGPLEVASAVTLKAVAFKEGMPSSAEAVASYALVPAAETSAAVTVGVTGGTLRGTVDPRGLAATGWFEWWTDSQPDPSATPPVDLGGGASPVPLSFEVTGLAPGTTCLYRVAASSGAGTARGGVLSFTTAAVAAPTLSPEGGTFDGPVSVTVSSATPGASIRYTLDGTLPTPTGGKVYSGPILLKTTTRVNALAYLPGVASSAVTGGDFLFTPSVQTMLPADVTTTGAGLCGRVNPRGRPVSVWFEWGTDPTLAAHDHTALQDIAQVTVFEAFSDSISYPAVGDVIYYRAAATGSSGVSYGSIRSFPTQCPTALVVNSLDDTSAPPPGQVTMRSALARIASGGTITFDPSLNGQAIDLVLVDDADTILKGEVFTMGIDPETGRMAWLFQGFQERNYGKSALYARKNVNIDAQALPDGITLRWAGGDALRARVLAVWGNLSMSNVTVASGYAQAQELGDDPFQQYSLGRGGGIAVWGTLLLTDCAVAGNRVVGDANGSRDRGAFGGGIYADTVELDRCVVSGNTVTGYGGAGGGIYSVSGCETWTGSILRNSSITGNRVTAQHAYGGGAYSDGGGPGNLNTLSVANCTIARNLVEDHPLIAQSQMSQYYYRGGGIYMSNGYLTVYGSTIAENAVTGFPWPFGGKPNMGGGAVAATIGNAHVVESMTIWHSILAGNTVAGEPADVFTGSLLDYYSYGYNLIGSVDFSQMLVPVPSWWCLSRRHYPKVGDVDGVALADVLDLGGAVRDPGIVSQGTDAGEAVVLWYPPRGQAVDLIPPDAYSVDYVWLGYYLDDGATVDDFPDLLLAKLRTDYPDELGIDFMAGYDTSAAVWYEEAYTWPSNPLNEGWIRFWHDVDAAIGDRLGSVRLGDDFWGSFPLGPFGGNVVMEGMVQNSGTVPIDPSDQLGNRRYAGPSSLGDVGAVEFYP